MLLIQLLTIEYKIFKNMHHQNRDYYFVYLRVNGCYFWFNVFQILTTVSLIALLLYQKYEIASFVEIFIAFLVALDLLIRYFTEGTKGFFNNWDNRMNMVILLLLIVSITSDLMAPQMTHHDGGIAAGLFLVARYIIQGVRLCRLFIESKKALEAATHQNINLNQIVTQEQNADSN